jgi:hypothetical protein
MEHVEHFCMANTQRTSIGKRDASRDWRAIKSLLEEVTYDMNYVRVNNN